MECCVKYNWKYKAEGNKHIVVSNEKGCCLRLQKCDLNSHKGCFESNNEQDDFSTNIIEADKLNELKFIQLIVHPLLSYSDACHIPEVVKLPKKFFHDLNKHIAADRPKHRMHQSLCCTSPALLMPDYCFVPYTEQYQKLVDNKVVFDSNTFAVEIKLKKGFLKQEDVVNNTKCICQFCKMQLYRVLQEKRHKRCSFYCPLDLFSGDEKRMKRALHYLFLSPQNNLRLFHNGELIYSQEILDVCLSKRCLKDINGGKPNGSFVEDLLPQLFKFNKIILLEPNTIIDILHKALLLPITSKAVKNITATESCYGESYKKIMCNYTIYNGVSLPSSKISSASLPSNSILGLILLQQKLGGWSLLNLHSKLQSLELSLNKNSDTSNKQASNVDATYESPGWKDFVLKHLASTTTNQENDGKV